MQKKSENWKNQKKNWKLENEQNVEKIGKLENEMGEIEKNLKN